MGWTEVLQSGRLNYLSSNFVLLRLSSSHVYNSINAILLKVLEIRYLMTSCLVPYPKNYISEGNSYFHYTLWGSQNPPFIFSTLCCCCSGTKSCPTLWTPWATVHQAPLSSAISQSLLKLMSIELAMPHNHFILCCPLHLLPSIFPSIRIFSNELALHIRWPKDFSFSISLSKEYSGLISFRIDWFDLSGAQGPLKSLLQHHSSEASNLQCSAFFMAQLSHPYMTTGKTIALTTQTLVSKVMSQLFNMAS